MKKFYKILVAIFIAMAAPGLALGSTTPNKKYNNQTTGSNVNTWGVVLNSNFTTIDNNLGGTLSLSVAGNSNVTLTNAQAQNLIYNFTGALTGDINVIFPAAGGLYFINNNTSGAHTLTIQAGTSTSGIVVPQGQSVPVVVDNSTSPPTVDGATGTNSSYFSSSTGGTANAITISETTPANFSLLAGDSVYFFATATNTGPVTLDVAGTGAIAVKKVSPGGLIDLAAGDLASGIPVIAFYNGTYWINLLNIYGGTVSSVSTNQSVSFANLYTEYVNTAAVNYTISRTATTLAPYWYIDIDASGGNATITPDANDSITVNGKSFSAGTAFVIPQGASARLYTNAAGNLYIRWMGTRLNAESTLSSATTTDLGTATSNIVKITGTTTITGFGSSASTGNPLYFLRFTGALTLTYNSTSLILPSAASITTADGDTAVAEYLGSGNWKVLSYTLASGKSLVTSATAAPASITGFTPSSITGTSTTATMTIAAGTASDSTNAAYITNASTESWAVSNGNAINGYSGGTTLPNSSTIHVYECSGASGVGSYAIPNSSYPITAASCPSGYTSYARRVFSFNTNSSGAPIAYTADECEGGSICEYYSAAILDVNAQTPSNSTCTAYALTVPSGIKVQPFFRWNSVRSVNSFMIISSPDEPCAAPSSATIGNYYSYWTAAPGFDEGGDATTYSANGVHPIVTNTSGQIDVRQTASATNTFSAVTIGLRDFRRN